MPVVGCRGKGLSKPAFRQLRIDARGQGEGTPCPVPAESARGRTADADGASSCASSGTRTSVRRVTWWVTDVAMADGGLFLERGGGGGWALAGTAVARFDLVNEYLGYLADRNYSPKTVRAYGYDLLAFCRWLDSEDVELAAVTTEVLLRFLRACREASVPGRPGPNVVRLSGPSAGPVLRRRRSTVGWRRSRACSPSRAMRDPSWKNPVPKGREARWRTSGERSGMLSHTCPPAEEAVRSLRLREPRRLPTAVVTAGGCRAVGQLPHLAGPRDRRADAVLRSALG